MVTLPRCAVWKSCRIASYGPVIYVTVGWQRLMANLRLLSWEHLAALRRQEPYLERTGGGCPENRAIPPDLQQAASLPDGVIKRVTHDRTKVSSMMHDPVSLFTTARLACSMLLNGNPANKALAPAQTWRSILFSRGLTDWHLYFMASAPVPFWCGDRLTGNAVHWGSAVVKCGHTRPPPPPPSNILPFLLG